jgi:tetratricopeptide (TPR) repeat protein
MVAALFALHPMNVESVAWAAERKNVLSMLFFLLALHAYVWYTRKPALLRYAVLFFLFALGLLSKSQIITFPFLLWLWDYWPLRRIFPPTASDTQAQGETSPRLWGGWLVLEKMPLLLLSAASAVVTMKAEKAGGAVNTFQYSLLLRLETAVISYVRYLEKALWPSKLVALYPHPTKLYPVWQVGAAVLVLLLVTAWVLRARDQRYLAVGWFWFLGSLVPMIGLVQVGSHAMADRFAYIPFIGLFLMLTWLAADCTKARQISARWLAIPAVSCLLVLGTLTYRQVGYWHDIESFWRRTLALTQDNYIAQVNLGDFLFSQGRTEEAAAHFRAALAIRPDGLTANLNLGAYEDSRGNLPAAIERYQMVAGHAAAPGMRATAYSSLGFAYRGMGQSMKAKQCFETALQLDPDWARAMIGLGLIAQENGDLAEAIRQYSRAAAVQPTDAGYLLLAQALRQEGRLDEANAISERVARFSPNLAEAQKTAESLLSGK